MKHYIAKDLITLHAGCVQLDAAQLKTRAHNLRPVGDGVHEIVRPIHFKRGERFGWDGEVPKAIAGAFGETPGAAVKKAFGRVVDAAKKLV